MDYRPRFGMYTSVLLASKVRDKSYLISATDALSKVCPFAKLPNDSLQF